MSISKEELIWVFKYIRTAINAIISKLEECQ